VSIPLSLTASCLIVDGRRPTADIARSRKRPLEPHDFRRTPRNDWLETPDTSHARKTFLTKIAPGYSEGAINFKDTWHVAVGAQYKLSEAYLFNGGVAYDSGFQDNNSVAMALPANAAWRFGIGGEKQESPMYNW
jgi:hypothetical protein